MPGDGRRRRRWPSVLLRWGAGLAVILGLVVAAKAWNLCYTSAICARCLQQARITETFLGHLRLWRSVALSAQHGVTPWFATPAADVAPAGPSAYASLFGTSCDHAFKRGCFGTEPGPLGGLFSDGIHDDWPRVLPRLQAIQALFQAYGRIGDRDSSVSIYMLIDQALPVQDETEALRAASTLLGDWMLEVIDEVVPAEDESEALRAVTTRLLDQDDPEDRRAAAEIREIAQQDSETGRCMRRILELLWLANRLEQIEAGSTLVEVRGEFEARLARA